MLQIMMLVCSHEFLKRMRMIRRGVAPWCSGSCGTIIIIRVWHHGFTPLDRMYYITGMWRKGLVETLEAREICGGKFEC